MPNSSFFCELLVRRLLMTSLAASVNLVSNTLCLPAGESPSMVPTVSGVNYMVCGLLLVAVLTASNWAQPAAAATYLTLAPGNFSQYVNGSAPAIVEFFYPGCPACSVFAKHYEKMAIALSGTTVVVAQINVQDYPDFIETFSQQKTVPQIMVFPRGWRSGTAPIIYSNQRGIYAPQVLQFALETMGGLTLRSGTIPDAHRQFNSFVSGALRKVEALLLQTAQDLAADANAASSFDSMLTFLYQVYNTKIRADAAAMGIFFARSNGFLAGYTNIMTRGFDIVYYTSNFSLATYIVQDEATGKGPVNQSLTAIPSAPYSPLREPWYPLWKSLAPGKVAYTPFAVWPAGVTQDLQSWIITPVTVGGSAGVLGIDLGFMTFLLYARVLKQLTFSELFLMDSNYTLLASSTMEESAPSYSSNSTDAISQTGLLPANVYGKNARKSSAYGAAADQVFTKFGDFQRTASLDPPVDFSFKGIDGYSHVGRVSLVSEIATKIALVSFDRIDLPSSPAGPASPALVALLVIASCLLGIAMAALAFMMYLQYRSRQKSKMTYNYFDEDLEQKKPTAG